MRSGQPCTRRGVEEGTTLVVTKIEVVTIGDPNVGSYKVTLSSGG